MKTIKEKLQKGLEKTELINNCPDTVIWVDSSSLYWVFGSGIYLYLGSHKNIREYLDNNHEIEQILAPEGVRSEGVFWNNRDFENPFHVSDFKDAIETVNF